MKTEEIPAARAEVGPDEMNLASERMRSSLQGLARWRLAMSEDASPHAVLKLRAHARRVESFARFHASALVDLPVAELRRTAAELIELLSPLRSLDLQADLFDQTARSLRGSEQGRACKRRRRFLQDERREALEAELRDRLETLDWQIFPRVAKGLHALQRGAPLPAEAVARSRCEALERALHEALLPLLSDFDQCTLDEARIRARELRYGIKAWKPCFGTEFYALNHGHAHRLQTLLAQAGDIETWVVESADFADSGYGRVYAIRARTWHRVLRILWAQRLNYLHQLARHPLVRSWMGAAGETARVFRSLAADHAPPLEITPIRPPAGAGRKS